MDRRVLPLQVHVFDMLGRQLASFTIKDMAPIREDLMPGSYVVRLSKGAETMAVRMHIQ
jgi:hypothetical protein